MTTDNYKLTYFNIRGRAEPIRYIFAFAVVPYEDIRIERADWPSQKQKFPWGQVPILEVNGKIMTQSITITRFLARKYKLTGADDFEAAKCDEIVDAMSDFRLNWRAYFFEQDEEKKETLKKELLEVVIPKYFSKYETIVKSSGGDYILGENVTWADFVIADMLEFLEDTVQPDIFNKYPALTKLKEAVYNIPNIKAWRATRPKTNM